MQMHMTRIETSGCPVAGRRPHAGVRGFNFYERGKNPASIALEGRFT
jgi:hypothetical protein